MAFPGGDGVSSNSSAGSQGGTAVIVELFELVVFGCDGLVGEMVLGGLNDGVDDGGKEERGITRMCGFVDVM